MRKFIHYDIPGIKRIDGGPAGRLYETPDGNRYPSVTTVVGAIGDKSYLEEWRDRVGHNEAAKITKRSANRGTLLHTCCERYLLGEVLTFDMFHQTEKEMFSYFLPVLNSIDEIHAMETQLYSDKLRVAGTVDLIAVEGGALKVLDWKNARYPKAKEDIPGYFAQMAAYAYMFWERTGVAVSRIKVVISVEDHGLVTYEEDVRDHLPVFIDARKKFDEN